MTETLDVCFAPGASAILEVRAIEHAGVEGFSCARQIEDRPPRRWELALSAEPHPRLFGHLRAFWRRVKGPVVPFLWTPPDAAQLLVRFVSPTLELSLDGPGRGSVRFQVEEAFGL